MTLEQSEATATYYDHCRSCNKPATWYGLCDECNEAEGVGWLSEDSMSVRELSYDQFSIDGD
jgi:hypothetical protein